MRRSRPVPVWSFLLGMIGATIILCCLVDSIT